MLFFKCRLMAPVILILLHSSMLMLTSNAFITSVKLNESASLSCSIPRDKSPVVMQWKRKGEIVAECGPEAKADFRFTCKMDDGKNILIVLQANSSTIGSYEVYCNGKEITNCRQFLKLVPPEEYVDLKAGDPLKLDLYDRKNAIIIFTKPGNSSVVEVCRVEEGVPQCRPEYQERVLIFRNLLKLLDMRPSDSGKYSVREYDQTLISSSSVTVKDIPQKAGYWQGFGHGAVISGLVMLFIGGVLGSFVGPLIRKCVQIYRERNHRNSNANVENGNGTVLLEVKGSESS